MKIQNIYIIIFSLVAIIRAKSIPSQIPNTVNKYQLRRPLRYMYYRLNSKINFNPIVGHIVRNKNICSSRLGPYCEAINDQNLQEFQIMQNKLTDIEKNAYNLQNYYQPIRFSLAQEIERTHTFFLTPSNQYKIMDAVVKRSVKDLIYQQSQTFYEQPQNMNKQQNSAKK